MIQKQKSGRKPKQSADKLSGGAIPLTMKSEDKQVFKKIADQYDLSMSSMARRIVKSWTSWHERDSNAAMKFILEISD
jgi:hypothetical protein